jgi:hypothetical protein
MAAAIALTACTIAGTARPAAISTTVPVVPTTAASAMPTVDPAAVLSASMASAAADQAAAAKTAADQAVADQAAAAKAAAEQSAAAQSAAEQAAAQSAAEKAAAEQAAADQAAEDAAAAEQSAAEQSAADADAAANGWFTPNGNWVSPQTAERALAAGIAPGDTVPDYLRCGTICGEGPTSGEVQVAHACQDGLLTGDDCAGIGP